jgi:NADPH-dependent curcumin reductase CurA
LKLRNKSGGQQAQQQPNFDFGHSDEPQAEEGDVDEEANEEVPVAKTTGVKTTSGRVVKKPKLDDYAYSSDIDKQIALQTVGKADESSENSYQGGSSTPARK